MTGTAGASNPQVRNQIRPSSQVATGPENTLKVETHIESRGFWTSCPTAPPARLLTDMSIKKAAQIVTDTRALYGRASSAGHMSPGSEPEALGQAADRGFSRLDSYWVGFTVESFVYTVEPPARTSRRTRAALPGRASPGSDLDDPLHLADVHVGTYSLVLRTNPIQSDERMRGRGRCPSSIIATISRHVRSRRCAAERS